MYVHFPPFAGLVAKQVDTTAMLSVGRGGEKTDIGAGRGGGQLSVIQLVRRRARGRYAQGLVRFTWEYVMILFLSSRSFLKGAPR